MKVRAGIEVSPALPLSPSEKSFADEYFAGAEAGNAVRSYLIVHEGASYATASVNASELLKSARVREYLQRLHDTAIETTAAGLRPWAELLPMAQMIVVRTAEGKIRNRLAYEAAREICNRVMGTPVSVGSHEVIVRDEARIAQAVSAFAKRMADERRRRVREVAG